VNTTIATAAAAGPTSGRMTSASPSTMAYASATGPSTGDSQAPARTAISTVDSSDVDMKKPLG
jgi:hypothetical protein